MGVTSTPPSFCFCLARSCRLLGLASPAPPPFPFIFGFVHSLFLSFLALRKTNILTVAGCGGSWGHKASRIPHFLHGRLTGDGWIVGLTCRPPFAPEGIPRAHFCSEAGLNPRTVVRLEGLGQLRDPITSPVIEPVTFWLVSWCISPLRYRVPPYKEKYVC